MSNSLRWHRLSIIALALTTSNAAICAPSHDRSLADAVDRYLSTFAAGLPVAERDATRAKLVAPGYFYHGMDGRPIGFDALTRRQTGNNLVIDERRIDNRTLHRSGNTALVTFHAFERGRDKGKAFSGTGSWVVVLTRTAAGWRVAADIVGQDPPAAH